MHISDPVNDLPVDWGDAPAGCTLANFSDNGYCIGDTLAVGSYPAGACPYGVLDIAGNVWEWVADWRQDSYYSTSPYAHPPGPDTGTCKVLRGGGWYIRGGSLRSAARRGSGPGTCNSSFGFRCTAPAGL